MILVLCPLAAELDIFRSNPVDKDRFHFALGGHGKVQFALETYRLGLELRPELILCVGAAGSLSPAVKPLDVVIGTETVEHDYNLKFIKRDKPIYAGHAPTLEKIKGSGMEGLHFGRIASGDEDVLDEKRAREIASETGTLAVAWEGAGGARAAAKLGIPYLEIRGITDRADHASIDSFKKNLGPAMEKVRTILLGSDYFS